MSNEEKKDNGALRRELIDKLFCVAGKGYQGGLELPEICSGMLTFAIDMTLRSAPSKEVAIGLIKDALKEISSDNTWNKEYYRDNDNIINAIVRLECDYPTELTSELIDSFPHGEA